MAPHIITSSIDKNIYIFVKKWFEPAIRVSYSKTEIVDKISEIQHKFVREALNHFKLKSHLEIAIMADLPAGTGMGSSSSFAVGLLNALNAYNRKKFLPKTNAELAFRLQHDKLKEVGGKQDQYAAAFGGIISMKISKNGNVNVKRLKIKPQHLNNLEERMVCFYTGIQRSAVKIQKKYCKSIENGKEDAIENLHKIKKLSSNMEESLINGKIDEIGNLFEEHWKAKKQISNNISNNNFDKFHDKAIESGAIGGKILGAGGGGYILFICEKNKKSSVKTTLKKYGLVEIPIKFSFEGSQIFNSI